MSEKQGSCPFHRGNSDAPGTPNVASEQVYKMPHQVHPATICPGLGSPQFICTHGLVALKQGRVLAFDYRNLSGEALGDALLDSIREYVCGEYDNFMVTLPETDFLSLRDLQSSVVDFYTAIQIALNRVCLELCFYRDVQEMDEDASLETVSELLGSSDAVRVLKMMFEIEDFKVALQNAINNPASVYQREAALMRKAAEDSKENPNAPIELLKIIQLNGNHLIEGKLHTFYMGPALDRGMIRYNPHHIIVITKASSFSTELLTSAASKRIRDAIDIEGVVVKKTFLIDPPKMGEEFFLGNTLFAVPGRISMDEYFSGSVKPSKPTDVLLPAIRDDIEITNELTVVAIDGGFQIGEDIFLIDQSDFPRTKITYTFNGKTGACVIQDTPGFYDDMEALYTAFCFAKVACIYQKVSNTVTGNTNECSVIFTIPREIEDSLK